MQSKKILGSKDWGLFQKNSQIAIPLKALDISIKIIHNVARIVYSQIYYNNINPKLETEFFFPIAPDACFDSFEVKFNHTSIKGVIKDKENAKKDYEKSVKEQRFAAYSEINEETEDIMKVLIGNIPMNTDVLVTYSYIQNLETALNKFWCFRLFSTLTPRYPGGDLRSSLDYDINLLSDYPTISEDSTQAYVWNIQAEIQSPSPITSLFSPSHDILTNYGNEKHTCTITLNTQSKHFPNKDFVLLYSNGREDKLDYLLTPFEDGYCAMVSLLADFDDKITQNEVYDNFVKAKESETLPSLNLIRGEYIFLIDRSGSMEDDRIMMARESLCLFLKSLPKDSYFNVMSFGSVYSLLHSSTQPYSQQILDSSIKQIEEFRADMGGTEIFEGLREIFLSTPPMKGYSRFIFLLTDGGVSNTKQVLDLIKTNNQKARVFTIGIGNGCSPELIIKGAIYGKGKHEFVTDNNQIYEKVISLLNASLSPCYSDLSLHADNFDTVVKCVSPNLGSSSFLINGEALTFFLFLRKNAFSKQTMNLKFKMYDSKVQKYREIDIALDISEAIDNIWIPKLGIFNIIKCLESQNAELAKKDESDITWLEKQDIKKAMLDYSVKHSILCKATAFFCEITFSKENSKTITSKTSSFCGLNGMFYRFWTKKTIKIYGPFPQKLTIPTIRSKDSKKLKSCRKKTKLLSYDASPCFQIASTSKCEIKTGLPMVYDKAFEELEVLAEKSPPQKNDCSNHYLDVIKNQKLDGYWDSNDEEVKLKVLKSNSLPGFPNNLFVADQSIKDSIWMTILVLLWLEIVYVTNKKAWILIHHKGYEWLKDKGVDYESVKNLGLPYIQSISNK